VENIELNASLKLDDVERQHIQRVLAMADGHLGATADMLGIHRNTLRRKLQQYDIHVD
jgi:ActR/RegA family two-component response regulator